MSSIYKNAVRKLRDERDKLILSRIDEGKTAAEIAKEFDIATSTVYIIKVKYGKTRTTGKVDEDKSNES